MVKTRIQGVALVLTLLAWVMSCEFVPVSSSPTLFKAPVLVGKRVYQGSLNGRNGLLFFAAHNSLMTAVYDTVRAGLYMVWRGPVLGEKRNAKGEYAPQGPLYQIREDTRFWTVLVGADTVIPSVQWLGFKEDSTGYCVFQFNLNLPGGRSIKVEESPLHDEHYSDQALLRTFKFAGLDSVVSLRLKLGSPHLTWDEAWSLSGAGVLERNIGAEALVMNSEDVSQIKVTWINSSNRTASSGGTRSIGSNMPSGN